MVTASTLYSGHFEYFDLFLMFPFVLGLDHLLPTAIYCLFCLLIILSFLH